MEGWLSALGSQAALYVPRILSAVALVIIAWIIGLVVNWVLERVLTAAHVDERYGKHIGQSRTGQPFSLSKTISNTAFWLVILLFLPSILNALALPGLFDPFSTMLTRIFAFLPNLFAAIVIFVVGWFVARVVQRVVTGLLAAAGVDRFADRIGVSKALGPNRLSSLLGTIVYLLILMPVIISALDALGIAAITGPASTMLNAILTALPNIFAAALMLVIAFAVGRVLAELVTDVLTAAGFNMILGRMGMTPPQPAPGGAPAPIHPALGSRTPAQVVGTLVLVAIMLFTAIEAMRLLGFLTLATMLAGILTLMGQILLGLVVFGIGVFLANMAYDAIKASGSGMSDVLAMVARVAILVLAGSMALRQMGLANEIVDLAFGLLLGAIAVAVALAFGLGGRETAARLLERWRARFEMEQQPTMSQRVMRPSGTPATAPGGGSEE